MDTAGFLERTAVYASAVTMLSACRGVARHRCRISLRGGRGGVHWRLFGHRRRLRRCRWQRCHIDLRQRAFVGTDRVREAEALLQRLATTVDRLHVGAFALALLVEGDQEGVLALHEIVAAGTHLLDPFQTVLHRLGTVIIRSATPTATPLRCR